LNEMTPKRVPKADIVRTERGVGFWPIATEWGCPLLRQQLGVKRTHDGHGDTALPTHCNVVQTPLYAMRVDAWARRWGNTPTGRRFNAERLRRRISFRIRPDFPADDLYHVRSSLEL
jgi:hypothetical protein